MAADRKDPYERAKRMARLIIRDIVLYNKDKIAEAIKNDSLFDALEKELEEGRKYYEKNVDPAVASQTNYFDEAVVDILVKGQGDVASGIW
jgi:O-methyltransferase involved in polyketide biosynthesis